jgi:membrane protease YdiL (CAAX protease family)
MLATSFVSDAINVLWIAAGHSSSLSLRQTSGFAAISPWLLIPFLFVNPVFEETLVRGYLMTEIMQLRSSAITAIVFSVAIQTSYHLYYGAFGALTVGSGLAVLAIYYAKSRRLMPVTLAHLLWDLTGWLAAWHR